MQVKSGTRRVNLGLMNARLMVLLVTTLLMVSLVLRLTHVLFPIISENIRGCGQ